MLVYNTEVETADLIHTAGYADMSTVTPADAFYSEYNTHTPDGTKLDTSKRATGVKILTDAEAEAVTVTDYFGNWDPYYYDSGDVSLADYSEVDEAIEKAEKLNADNYVDFSGVSAAIEAVVRDLPEAQQSEVDAMAKAINDAVAALQLKPADYSKVDEAVEAAGKLNADDYKDFAAVTAAVNAVVRDYTIDKQSEVDAMAKAINDAITALDKKTEDKPEEPDKPDAGNIEVNTDSKIPVSVDGTKAEIAEKIPMTEEEKKQYDGGANIAISIKIEDNSAAVSKEDKETVEKLLKEETLGQYIDISVFKTIGSNPQTKVAETKGMIKISIKLPENLKNTDATKKREYYIVRVHDGVATKLDTVYNEADGTLTFASDKFSTYAIVYKDTVINNVAPSTGDTTSAAPFVILLSLSAVLMAGIYFYDKKRKALVKR